MSNQATERLLANERNHGSHAQPVKSALFATRNMSILAYANGFTLWHYKAPKITRAEIMNANYFGDAADMLSEGDMVLVSAKDGAFIVFCALAGPDTVTVAAVG